LPLPPLPLSCGSIDILLHLVVFSLSRTFFRGFTRVSQSLNDYGRGSFFPFRDSFSRFSSQMYLFSSIFLNEKRPLGFFFGGGGFFFFLPLSSAFLSDPPRRVVQVEGMPPFLSPLTTGTRVSEFLPRPGEDCNCALTLIPS